MATSKLTAAAAQRAKLRQAGPGSAYVTPPDGDIVTYADEFPASGRPNQLPEDSELRNSYPMADGLFDYFPNALAEVSRVSYIGNQKHNPGEPMNWARGKSTDHRNKIARHLIDTGGFEETVVDGKPVKVRHSAYLAWRALANLQEELEREEGYPMSRASTPPDAV